MAILTFFCIFVSAENVGRLKKLEYLNLALNNIEVIENLEGDRLFYFFPLLTYCKQVIFYS